MPKNMRQLMHEKLDGVLSEELTEELLVHLERDREAAQEYARLQSVDGLLSSAPTVRAPQRLAVTIMARLAKNLEMQAQLQALPDEAREALLQSLSVSMMTMMPMMVGASWLVMYAMGDPSVLVRVLERVIVLMSMLIDAQIVVLEEIEPYLKDDPELATACLQLLPSMMIGLLDYMEGQ
jgi:anti-sigma factor RsiW